MLIKKLKQLQEFLLKNLLRIEISYLVVLVIGMVLILFNQLWFSKIGIFVSLIMGYTYFIVGFPKVNSKKLFSLNINHTTFQGYVLNAAVIAFTFLNIGSSSSFDMLYKANVVFNLITLILNLVLLKRTEGAFNLNRHLVIFFSAIILLFIFLNS